MNQTPKAQRWERIAALIALLMLLAGVAVATSSCGGDDLALSGMVVEPPDTTTPEPTETPVP